MLGSVASADAPNVLYRIEFQGLDALVGVYQAAVAIALIFLCEVRGNLGEGLVESEADADGHTHVLLHFLVQVLAPLFK